jgi:MFS family permease
MPKRSANESKQAGRALDAANFFLADVRDGLGPYLAIYLLTEKRWDEARIGVVMSIATAAGIAAQTPAGALIDATRAKRLVMAAAAILVTIASLSLPLAPGFLPVAILQGIAHAAGVIFPPAIAAVSLGIVGHRAFTRRIGRNETFNHAGRFNVAQGAVITAQNIGAALSTTLAGLVVVSAGYSAAFVTLGAIAGIGAAICFVALPETRQSADTARHLRGKTAAAASAIAAE